MATATAVNPAGSALDVASELVTVARIVYVKSTNADGEKEWEFKQVGEDVAKDIETKGTFEVNDKEVEAQVENYQTFSRYKVNSVAGALQLMPEEEVVNMINSGVSVKQGNAIRTLILGKDKKSGEFDFNFTESPYDLKTVLAEVTNKRLTPTEKLTRDLTEGLDAIPSDMLDKFAALIEARKQALLGQ